MQKSLRVVVETLRWRTDSILISVTIVGAGPAGLIAAEILAKRGVEAIIIDKDTNPGEKKPCAGMVRDAAVKMFCIPPKLASRRISGITVVLPNHRVEEVEYTHPVFFNFDRAILGEHLVNRVSKLGVKVNTGIRVVDVSSSSGENGHDAYELACVSSSGETMRIKTDLLIAADGANSTVIKKTGVHRPLKANQLGLCVQYQLQLDNNSIEKRIGDRNEIYYGRDISPFGYAWLVPKDNLVTVGVGALLSMVGSNLKDYLDYLVKRHPVASKKLLGGKILGFESALCPLSGLVSPTYGDRLIVSGDAAGHCSPISGEGIYYSMVAGAIAGEVSSEAVRINDLSAGFLGKYEHVWHRTIGSDLRWGKWLQRIALRRGFMSGAFIKESEITNRLNRRITDILAGVRPYRESIVKAIPDFLATKVIKTISGSSSGKMVNNAEN